MPVIVNSESEHPFLPSRGSLGAIDAESALHQDIRPLEILAIILMADKIGTERQLAQWLGRTPLQIHVTFAATDSYIDDIRSGRESKHTPREHIEKFYSRFGDIRKNTYDGVIITGINALESDITKERFWPQVQEIFDWSSTHVTSSLFLCWGAQAALKHFHHIDRYRSPQKTYGVFGHEVVSDVTGLLDGFADVFPIPVSRWNEIRASDICRVPELELTSVSDEAGVSIITEPRSYGETGKQYPYRIYLLSHPEYETEMLGNEYRRDSAKDPSFPKPAHYFPRDNPAASPINTWRHTGSIYENWIRIVYAATPYHLQELIDRVGTPTAA